LIASASGHPFHPVAELPATCLAFRRSPRSAGEAYAFARRVSCRQHLDHVTFRATVPAKVASLTGRYYRLAPNLVTLPCPSWGVSSQTWALLHRGHFFGREATVPPVSLPHRLVDRISPVKTVDLGFSALPTHEDMIIHLFAIARWFHKPDRHFRAAFWTSGPNSNRTW
jgi:hypothetical protein